MDDLIRQRISISLPSLRVNTISERTMQEIKRVRKTGFTIAPEAGSERLRKVINKGFFTDDELEEEARRVFAMGWQNLKLYFMYGLPTERIEDLNMIISLIKKVKNVSKGYKQKPTISVNLSPFVPKPHTPFQWEEQMLIDESISKLSHLKKRLSGLGVKIKFTEPAVAYLEGILSRGDRLLSQVILSAYRNGARLDSWTDYFKFHIWLKAFEETGVDVWRYVRKREMDEVLPWEHLFSGLSKEFLKMEYKNAINEQETKDCADSECTKCGICDFSELKPVKKEEQKSDSSIQSQIWSKKPEWVTKLRIRFEKKGVFRYLNAREIMHVIHRALRRVKIPVIYSEGFNPLPRVSFGFPTPVGVESYDEYFDIELEGPFDPITFKEKINQTLPAGLKVLSGQEVPIGISSIYSSTKGFLYEFNIDEKYAKVFEGAEEIFEKIKKSKEYFIEIEGEGGVEKKDLKPFVQDLVFDKKKQ